MYDVLYDKPMLYIPTILGVHCCLTPAYARLLQLTPEIHSHTPEKKLYKKGEKKRVDTLDTPDTPIFCSTLQKTFL
jgi:hypothetical protein